MEQTNEKIVVKQEKPARNAAFELLRIIAMLFIIAHHFYVHGGFSSISPTNKALMTFFEFGGKFGVAIFVMISGYFLVNSKFKIKKLIKLVLQIWFYSVAIYLILCLCGLTKFTSEDFVWLCFPISNKINHFVTKYIIIFLLSPFINKMLHALSQKQHLALVLVSLGMFTLFKYSIGIKSDLTIFFILYFIGSYLRLHKIPFKKTKLNYLLLSLAILVVYAIVILVKNFTKMNTYTETNLLMILLATLVMFLFEQFEIKSKAINFIATTTFGIYLIHDNYFLGKIIWRKIFAGASFGNSPYLFLYGIFAVVTVFICCAIIDLIRQYGIEKPIAKLFGKIKFKKKAATPSAVVIEETKDTTPTIAIEEAKEVTLAETPTTKEKAVKKKQKNLLAKNKNSK